MSSGKRATVSVWQRDHDGSYTAEINGHNLRVVWQPENDQGEKGFRWEATAPDGSRQAPRELMEEIELAMAAAEAAAEVDDEEEDHAA